MLVAFSAAMLAGQFFPNRNIVTADQLEKTTMQLQTEIATLNTQMSGLSKEVAELTGELKAERETNTHPNGKH